MVGPEQQPSPQPEFKPPTEEQWGLRIDQQILLFVNPQEFEPGSLFPESILLMKIDLACQYLGSFWPPDQIESFVKKYGSEAEDNQLSVAALAIKHDLQPSWPGSSDGSLDQALALAKYEAGSDVAARARITYIEELFRENERVFSPKPKSVFNDGTVCFPPAPWPNNSDLYQKP